MINIGSSSVCPYPYVSVFFQNTENDIVTEFRVFTFIVGDQFPFRIVAEKSLSVWWQVNISFFIDKNGGYGIGKRQRVIFINSFVV